MTLCNINLPSLTAETATWDTLKSGKREEGEIEGGREGERTGDM